MAHLRIRRNGTSHILGLAPDLAVHACDLCGYAFTAAILPPDHRGRLPRENYVSVGAIEYTVTHPFGRGTTLVCRFCLTERSGIFPLVLLNWSVPFEMRWLHTRKVPGLGSLTEKEFELMFLKPHNATGHYVFEQEWENRHNFIICHWPSLVAARMWAKRRVLADSTTLRPPYGHRSHEAKRFQSHVSTNST